MRAFLVFSCCLLGMGAAREIELKPDAKVFDQMRPIKTVHLPDGRYRVEYQIWTTSKDDEEIEGAFSVLTRPGSRVINEFRTSGVVGSDPSIEFQANFQLSVLLKWALVCSGTPKADVNPVHDQFQNASLKHLETGKTMRYHTSVGKMNTGLEMSGKKYVQRVWVEGVNPPHHCVLPKNLTKN